MANPYFSFKQFTVRQDRCAMKVSTDGVLLGAWADVSGACRVLDIGTGTGVIALMLAQRGVSEVRAVEIDADAAEQATANVLASPWADRIRVVQADILAYAPDVRFDRIVSNPPYFVDSLKCPDAQRTTARHAVGLDADALMQAVARLLLPDGTCSVIVPTDLLVAFTTAAGRHGLFPARRTYVRTKPGIPPKRVLLEFRYGLTDCQADELLIEQAPGSYTEAYRALTCDFYLRM